MLTCHLLRNIACVLFKFPKMTLFPHNNLNPDLISLSCENMSFQGQDLVIGNVGDSRAVLATRDKDDSLLAVQLTVDLKPDLPSLSLSLKTHSCTLSCFALGSVASK